MDRGNMNIVLELKKHTLELMTRLDEDPVLFPNIELIEKEKGVGMSLEIVDKSNNIYKRCSMHLTNDTTFRNNNELFKKAIKEWITKEFNYWVVHAESDFERGLFSVNDAIKIAKGLNVIKDHKFHLTGKV